MNPEFQKYLEKLDDKLDKVVVIQAEMQRDIAHHIRRTDVAEKRLEILHTDMEPIKRHVAKVHGVLAALGGISLVIGIVAGILKIVESM